VECSSSYVASISTLSCGRSETSEKQLSEKLASGNDVRMTDRGSTTRAMSILLAMTFLRSRRQQ
jgi:hypothetical protein